MTLQEAIDHKLVTIVSVTPCDSCPCLNNDYEQGTECNLEYTTDHHWNKDLKLINGSADCELNFIDCDSKAFIRDEPVEAVVRTDGRHFHPHQLDREGDW